VTVSNHSTRQLDKALQQGSSSVRLWVARRLRKHALDWMPLEEPPSIYMRCPGPFVKQAAENDPDFKATPVTQDDE